jgi:D-arabinose 1-dehydrogenase-like Zn-dependent alcohol dehydrogenase
VVALAERGSIRAATHQFKLDEAMEAYECMATGELHGRVIVVP